MLFPNIAHDNRNFKPRKYCMKKGILGMVVFLIAATMVFGLASQSYAGGRYDGGPGDVLLFTYYDARSVADGGLGLRELYYNNLIIPLAFHYNYI
jgi:heme/copper-type cytochrome/quinol oxidase subunit 3